MSPPHILVTPNVPDIYNFLSKMLKNIAESCKHFVRWMDGTCIECKAPENDEEDVRARARPAAALIAGLMWSPPLDRQSTRSTPIFRATPW